jgi:hypothetical protein
MDVFVKIAQSGEVQLDGTSCDARALAYARNLRDRVLSDHHRGTLRWRDLLIAQVYAVAAVEPGTPALRNELLDLVELAHEWSTAIGQRS